MYTITLKTLTGRLLASTTASSDYEASICAMKLRFSVSRATVTIKNNRSKS